MLRPTAFLMLFLAAWTTHASTQPVTSAPISSDTKSFLPPEMLQRINCRIGRRTPQNPESAFEIYKDVELNTISENAVDYSFETPLPNGKKLGVMLKRVSRRHSTDQFSLRIFLDREPIFRTGFIDLDLYLEFAIESGPLYLLHCFPPID